MNFIIALNCQPAIVRVMPRDENSRMLSLLLEGRADLIM